MKLQYFSPETDPNLYTCNETGETGMDDDFLLKYDRLRAVCGFAFNVAPGGGFRSLKHSTEKKKARPTGQHPKGRAADTLISSGNSRYLIVKHAIRLGFTGIGIAKTFVHVDTRTGPMVIWTY